MYKQKLCLGILEGFDMPYTEQVRLMKKAGFEAFFIDDCNRHAPVDELVALSKELGMEIPSYHAPFNKSYDMWQSGPKGDAARDELMKIYGVGEKVADCVLLFGLGRVEVIPKDVWIKRVLTTLYGGALPDYAAPYAGIAQQFLFHYARMTKLEIGE